MNRIICIIFSLALSLMFVADTVDAGQKARGQAKSSVNSPRNAGANNRGNVNRNTNVNVNSNRSRDVDVDIDVDVDHHGGRHHGGCCYHDNYHPIATAVAVTATAVVVGSIVNTLPPSCSTVIVNGFAYQQCGGTWYQPQISGSSTTYIVVNNPPGY
jgi:hypothetical protein